ncbi:type I-C CRISPR-associated protein Cas7/Csd2 [Alienimonas californiensis]|uniref:Type I-C CRISPR-associated protein Cas7/Csd2 n=1 Tax=Alienimonas californiensis TaxID=2527989 RepID=A0A517PAL2_9PLAN|nr:type I-C CRISPR-associated protein Cas7/Csd2 [Alienimonas californiensis]QDT16412.1 hypothetical protein CA12_25140 [Alienimonas californiensis]
MHRYDFVFLFDVTDGNPNGDPDAGNLPRIDPETGAGLVTDVCLKRKIRNYVGLVHGETPPHEIYVKEKAVLNAQHERAYVACDLDPKAKKRTDGEAARLKDWMCGNFYDVRTFGAVMTTGVNCGQVRGPVQLTFARSVDPVVTLEHAVTRCAVTTEAEAEKQSGDNRTMGRKFTLPYGLYRAHGFVNPHLAEQTGFGDDDLALLWKSLEQMFEYDRSAARGQMTARRLIAFKHDSALGNAPAHKLFSRVKTPGLADSARETPPRRFEDYEPQIAVDLADLPVGVTVEELI